MSSVHFQLRRKLSSMASVPCSVFGGTQFDGGVGERAGRVGVVTLSTDQTIGTSVTQRVRLRLSSVQNMISALSSIPWVWDASLTESRWRTR